MKRRNLKTASKLSAKLSNDANPAKKQKMSKSPHVSGNTVSPYFQKTEQKRLGSAFYHQECIQLSKSLLGKVLVRKLNGKRLSGRIVETEAYLGIKDSACHSYKGHQSDNNKAMWMDPGYVYVYLIYGMYHCMNISGKGDGNAVLLRGLEPVDGEEVMQKLRSKRRKSSTELKRKALCSGPGKLTEALQITKALFDKESLVTNSEMWVEDAPVISDDDIVSCPRIGIDYATKEWKEKPLRFYIRGNACVSKRDKGAE
ncbi:DNA-3-methyladenine glycosylase [Holothuria leucospilota]|uniref:DNA-3-methyladenine glycosylase n=1 Tax=Holothuria leucospilota TaxID=206669 RepID=A0A9Q1HA11_HOLLE|nr:DNA-3-methyladenine glycosylase [Holothuria leucospilota]